MAQCLSNEALGQLYLYMLSFWVSVTSVTTLASGARQLLAPFHLLQLWMLSSLITLQNQLHSAIVQLLPP
jgi:hypothetical protein